MAVGRRVVRQRPAAIPLCHVPVATTLETQESISAGPLIGNVVACMTSPRDTASDIVDVACAGETSKASDVMPIKCMHAAAEPAATIDAPALCQSLTLAPKPTPVWTPTTMTALLPVSSASPEGQTTAGILATNVSAHQSPAIASSQSAGIQPFAKARVDEFVSLVRSQCRQHYGQRLDHERRRWRAELAFSEMKHQDMEDRLRRGNGRLIGEFSDLRARIEEVSAVELSACTRGDAFSEQLETQEGLTACVSEELRACNAMFQLQDCRLEKVAMDAASKLSLAQEELAATRSAAIETTREGSKSIRQRQKEVDAAVSEFTACQEHADAAVDSYREAAKATGEELLAVEAHVDRSKLAVRRATSSMSEEAQEAKAAFAARDVAHAEVAGFLGERENLSKALAVEAARVATSEEVVEFERQRWGAAEASTLALLTRQAELFDELLATRAVVGETAEELMMEMEKRTRDRNIFTSELLSLNTDCEALHRARNQSRHRAAAAQEGIGVAGEELVRAGFEKIGTSKDHLKELPPLELPTEIAWETVEMPGANKATRQIRNDSMGPSEEVDQFEAIGSGKLAWKSLSTAPD